MAGELLLLVAVAGRPAKAQMQFARWRQVWAVQLFPEMWGGSVGQLAAFCRQRKGFAIQVEVSQVASVVMLAFEWNASALVV